MLTDKIRNLRNTLVDLGFPSVLEMDDNATMRDYRSVLNDAWPQCDQTSDDADAFELAHDAIDSAFRA